MVFGGGLVATYNVYTSVLHISDSLLVLILPLAVSSFNVIICKTFFKTTIPQSILESAEIDGASQMRTYFTIVLPISKPLLATITDTAVDTIVSTAVSFFYVQKCLRDKDFS